MSRWPEAEEIAVRRDRADAGAQPKLTGHWALGTGHCLLNEDLAVYAAAERAAAEGRIVALATIVRCRGSTPRGCGSKMLVDPERGLTGTVGGGCGEAEVIEAAAQVIATGRPRLLRIDLTEDLFS